MLCVGQKKSSLLLVFQQQLQHHLIYPLQRLVSIPFHPRHQETHAVHRVYTVGIQVMTRQTVIRSLAFLNGGRRRVEAGEAVEVAGLSPDEDVVVVAPVSVPTTPLVVMSSHQLNNNQQEFQTSQKNNGLRLQIS